MNTPLSWIKAYVPDLNVTAQEYADAIGADFYGRDALASVAYAKEIIG